VRSMLLAVAVALVVAVTCAPYAIAAFPYGSGGPEYRTGPGEVPNDIAGDDNEWKYSATPEANSPYTANARELYGVRGARVADRSESERTAWRTTTGRPDVKIAVLDSGIKWNDAGAMLDLRRKTALNRGELPHPEGCTQYDCNGDGVFNVDDYSSDSRVSLSDPRRVGPAGVLTPQDLLIAFSNGNDGDSNGFVDDIAGWDFLDDDNDAYDDVQYGHGTGEAQGSSAEADNGNNAGSCPNCVFMPLRVGDSFIADTNAFGQAAIYAVDSGALVVQEALGTIDQTQLGRQAVEYAYRHGVAVIASAADEAAQHHNWPSNYPHTIVVNSVTQWDSFTPTLSYLQFNGCTNFSTHITVAIPSTSCSSDATGVGGGLAGLIYSAALNSIARGDLGPHPECTRVNGDPCPLSVNEVRQLMASGAVDGTLQADDINFASQPEAACHPIPAPGCTDKNRLFADANANRPVASPLVTSKSYPARKDFDEYYGYGRVNMDRVADSINQAAIPPEAEITSPDWYAQVDPGQPTVAVQGEVFARGNYYSCRVEVAPGSEPNNGRTTDIPPGDFKRVSSNWCDGTLRTSSFEGVLADLDLQDLKSRFPSTAGNFNGPEPVPGPPNFNGRPNHEPYGFVVRVVVETAAFGSLLSGQDRRNFYLHRDSDLLPGFPKLLPSDGESSPALADLDGDNRNELIVATSDGYVHAYGRDGGELSGWPVRSDPLPLHTGGHAFTSGEVDEQASHAAILTSTSVVDLDHDGSPEVIGADMGGKVYVWEGDGTLRFKREANIDFSGKPLQPFENVRRGHRYRTQHGYLGSPVAADLDGNGGDLEVVAANMDRHVYAWRADGSQVDGFPVLVIDRSKISAIDSQTHAPTFRSDIGDDWNQGAIVDTPAVGDLNGDGKPEIVIGTNEEYQPNADGGVNAGNLNTTSLSLLAQTGQLDFANSRLFAIKPQGEPGGPTVSGPSPFLAGWPKRIAFINKELLPVVGEGMTGSPVIGTVNCPSGGDGPKVGAISAAGPAYLFNPNGSSCYGQSPDSQGRQQDNAMQTDFAASSQKYDTPAIPAVGHPAMGQFAGGTSFIVPAAGVIRALDLAVNEYQGGQDFVAALDPQTGQFRPEFPSPVNDLQFLTGPSIADLDGLPGEEVLGGTASLELYGMNAAGASFDPGGWPKLTGDWTVANPVVGSLGTTDTDSSARKVVVALTRSGSLFAYSTQAPACSAGSWPRFHHDNASSGDLRRDAVSPGKPTSATISGGTISFDAPGDDLLCGTADHYQVVTSDNPITGANFGQQAPLSGAPAPASAGSGQSFPVPAGARRYVGIRAVDEQGNVGRPVVLQARHPRPGGATPLRVSLVPEFQQCASPNSSHVPPLDMPSCRPPALSSSLLTTSSQGRGSASARLDVQPGDPDTSTDEADLKIGASASDVSAAADGSDYAGKVLLSTRMRITDNANGSASNDSATVEDFDFSAPVDCVANNDPALGSSCQISTTADTLVPGFAVEGRRSVISAFSLAVLDTGADGQVAPANDPLGLGCPPTCGSGDEKVYLRQGVFAP
jgi:FG-GAP repeat protein